MGACQFRAQAPIRPQEYRPGGGFPAIQDRGDLGILEAFISAQQKGGAVLFRQPFQRAHGSRRRERAWPAPAQTSESPPGCIAEQDQATALGRRIGRAAAVRFHEYFERQLHGNVLVPD